MDTVTIDGPRGPIPTLFSAPDGQGPWPAVVVVHDALGMTADLATQVRWLAEAGYVVAAPDLFHSGGHFRCLFRAMRELQRGSGVVFEEVSAVRRWLLEDCRTTSKVGLVGFCFGGGIALALAPAREYSAVAANYGSLTDTGWDRIGQACPIVASYGADDKTCQGDSQRIARVLLEHGVEYDVKEYPGVGHGFMNDHDSEQVGWVLRFLSWVSNTRYDEAATLDARRRILAFFDQHLKPPPVENHEGS